MGGRFGFQKHDQGYDMFHGTHHEESYMMLEEEEYHHKYNNQHSSMQYQLVHPPSIISNKFKKPHDHGIFQYENGCHDHHKSRNGWNHHGMHHKHGSSHAHDHETFINLNNSSKGHGYGAMNGVRQAPTAMWVEERRLYDYEKQVGGRHGHGQSWSSTPYGGGTGNNWNIHQGGAKVDWVAKGI